MRKGFTYTELLIVLMIIAIVASIVLPGVYYKLRGVEGYVIDKKFYAEEYIPGQNGNIRYIPERYFLVLRNGDKVRAVQVNEETFLSIQTGQWYNTKTGGRYEDY